MDILIKDGKVLINNKLIKKNIIIKNSKIYRITNQAYKADEVINAKGKIIFPGIIDSHVHFREPGLTHKEDFLSGSMASAKGGITTILDMPNTIPPTTTVRRLEEKRELAKKSVVNYGFHFGATSNNLNEIKKVKRIASVKVFMDITTGEMRITNNNILKKIFSLSPRISVHAEHNNILKAINIIKETKNMLYLCHISTKHAINVLKSCKTRQIFAEVTPHHLFLTNKDVKRLKSFAMMKPPLGTEQDRNSLWQAIHNGIIDTIATDHAPHTIEEKETTKPFGVPGVETMLPLLLNAVNRGKLDLATIKKLCCENPAQIFRIKNKGFIKVNYDADLVIIDMHKKEKVKADSLFTKCGWSPFEGKILKGWPITTIVNGNIVYDKGCLTEIRAKEVSYYN